MAITRHLLRILHLSLLLNMIPSSMSLQINSLQQPHQQLSCPEYVGVFDPNVPSVYVPGPVVTIGSDMVYRDIYTWVEILNELADILSDKDVITQVIQPCLRGSAATWWNFELTGEEREKLRKANLRLWCSILMQRFKFPTADAWGRYFSISYDTQDLDLHPRIWFHQMIQYNRPFGADNTFSQLWSIWAQLDRDLRKDIPMPNSTTKIIDFLETVDEMYPTWVIKYQRSQYDNTV